MGLVPAKHLGKELADLQPHLLQMKEYAINLELSMFLAYRFF